MHDIHFIPMQRNSHDFFPNALELAERRYLSSNEIDILDMDTRTQNEDWQHLVAIRLLLGTNTPTDNMYLICCEQNVRTVLEDHFLRAWVVGAYCSDMIAELELQQDVESAFSDGGSPSIEAEIIDFKNLRYYAARVIAEGNEEAALTLLSQFTS
jgi:beta-glucosidase/6-phospho-beta-glucosidase/beta-galactosidase